MNLITLNTWGGRAGKAKLLEFFNTHSPTDIFCLQEIWSAPYENYNGYLAGGLPVDHSQIMTQGMQEISAVLPDHVGYFRPHFGDNYGLFMLVHKSLKVIDEGEVFVYKEKGYIVPHGDIGNHARNIQYVTIERESEPFTIINFHGLWNGQGKTDSPDRIKQSENILNFIKNLKGDFVMCGDFNLTLATESIRMLEEAGLRNLIRENGIQSTRTSYYTKPDKFADYIFMSKGIHANSFTVLPDVVSDHAPLFCNFDL